MGHSYRAARGALITKQDPTVLVSRSTSPSPDSPSAASARREVILPDVALAGKPEINTTSSQLCFRATTAAHHYSSTSLSATVRPQTDPYASAW
jgi:hypothetical protein